MSKAYCIVCNYMLKSPTRKRHDNYIYRCKNCGWFQLTSTTVSLLPSKLQESRASAILSHAIWKMHNHSEIEEIVELTRDHIDSILENSTLPKPSEQINNFIIWVGDNSNFFGDIKPFRDRDIQEKIGALNGQNIGQIITSLGEKVPKLIKTNSDNVLLTIDGWQRYEELKRVVHDSRNAFMAMQFGDSELDSFYKDHFKAAVDKTGYDLKRVDEKPKAGIIDVRMEVEIRNSRFVIADLSHKNNGVYWEAGFASGLGLPVIYTCRHDKTKGVHWDANHRLFVPWDPDHPEEAKKQLKDVIRATLPTQAKMADDG